MFLRSSNSLHIGICIVFTNETILTQIPCFGMHWIQVELCGMVQPIAAAVLESSQ